jgi:hypothetical protein
MIRDNSEINDLASGFGIIDAGSAVKFLNDRRRAAEEFEAFVRGWPQAQGDNKNGEFSESLAFGAIRLAETDESLARLKELLVATINEVVNRCRSQESDGIKANGDGKADAAESLRMKSQDALKKFDEARRTQRNGNQQLAKVKATCEAWLVGQWLSTNVDSLREVFDVEPAAFVFRSTVPLVEADVRKMPTSSRRPIPPSPPPIFKPKQEEEGVLRSLFRWLFG